MENMKICLGWIWKILIWTQHKVSPFIHHHYNFVYCSPLFLISSSFWSALDWKYRFRLDENCNTASATLPSLPNWNKWNETRVQKEKWLRKMKIFWIAKVSCYLFEQKWRFKVKPLVVKNRGVKEHGRVVQLLKQNKWSVASL